ARSDSFKDPKGDNKCCGKSFDFTKASAGTSGTDFKFTAKVKGKASKSLPFLLINPHGSKGCDFRIGPVNGDPGIANCNDASDVKPADQVGTSGSKGFKYVFPEDSIGSPSKLKWQFVYTQGEYGAGVIDRAPNKAKTLKP